MMNVLPTTARKITHTGMFNTSYKPHVKSPSDSGVKLRPDTVISGFHYRDIPRWLILEIHDFLKSIKSNEKVDVDHFYQPTIGSKNEIKAYKRTVKLTVRDSKNECAPYVHITYDKHFLLKNPYDVKFSCHMSRLKDVKEVISILEMADPSGLLKFLYIHSVISRLDLKFDFLEIDDLNFFLKTFDCKNSWRPHIIRNREDGRRTFQLNKKTYFYEKPLGRGKRNYIRLEIRLIGSDRIQKHFPGLDINTLLEGNSYVSNNLFRGWELITCLGKSPITVPQRRIDRKVQSTLKKIDLLGKGATRSLLMTKGQINKTKKDKGKFRSHTKNLYKRERFFEDFLQKQKVI